MAKTTKRKKTKVQRNLINSTHQIQPYVKALIKWENTVSKV